MVEYDKDETHTVTVNSAVLENRTAYNFVTGSDVSFSMSKAAYKVECLTNGSNSIELTTTSTEAPYTYTHTPATVAGFTLRIYWTQEQYNFQNLHSKDGQFMVEYSWEGNGSVSHTGGVTSATYNNCTRVVLANGTASLELTLTPTPDGSPANVVTGIMVGGQSVDSENYAGNTYTMTLDNNYAQAQVSFTGSGGPNPPSGETYTITPTAGENGSISPNTEQTVNEGEGRQFTFQPDIGYEVDEVLVDGQPVQVSQPEYGFQDVREGHTIHVTFRVISGNPGTPADAKTKIDGRRWAYAGDAAAVKAAFETELWDMASHEFSGVFADKAAVEAAVTLSPETSSAGTELAGKNYYTFTVELGENDATGRIYVLENAEDYVVMTRKGAAEQFTTVSGQECTVTEDFDEGGIAVFGNGAAIEGKLGSDGHFAAFHVADRVGLGAVAFRLAVYKPDFAGVKAVGSGEESYAAAWGFAQFPTVSLNGSTEEEPAEFELFFGNSSVTISDPAVSGTAIRGITDISSSLPDGAVSISNNEGAFTVAFRSNFFDEVPLTVTYSSAEGAKTAYLTIRRVGIDIQSYQRNDGDFYNTNHGTDPGLQAQPWEDSDYAVYATYYYPTGTYTDGQKVTLIANITWQDGSTTVETLSQAEAINTPSENNACACDDFLVYKGSYENAPTGVSVTAVVGGLTGERFGGASLGSGAGVSWEKPDDR